MSVRWTHPRKDGFEDPDPWPRCAHLSEAVAEYKPSTHTPLYGPKLQEYVSKPCRRLLVKAITLVIREDLEEEKNVLRRKGAPLGREKGKWSAFAHLANALDVSTITIEKWLNDERRGNNENIWKLIELGLKKAPEDTIRLLEEDMENHRQRFLALLSSHHTGVYAPRITLEADA